MERIKLYILKAPDDFTPSYGYYEQCLVVATSEEAARQIHPIGHLYVWNKEDSVWYWDNKHDYMPMWPNPNLLTVTHVGSVENDNIPNNSVLMASFNVGREY